MNLKTEEQKDGNSGEPFLGFCVSRFFAGRASRDGFTLVEFLVVMATAAVIAAISVTAVIRPQTQADLDGEMLKIISDLKAQQLGAMIGLTSSTTVPTSYGIYFSTNDYTLFRGTSYNPADPENFSVSFPSAVQMESNTLATSTIIFNRLTGEVYAYSASANSVNFINTVSNATSSLSINRFGAITKTP